MLDKREQFVQQLKNFDLIKDKNRLNGNGGNELVQQKKEIQRASMKSLK